MRQRAIQGDLDAAQMAYLEAIRLLPGFVPPRFNLADGIFCGAANLYAEGIPGQ